MATANTSDAALFRLVAADVPPTLLFDEVDALFSPNGRDREDTRALLNAGTRRGVPARRCVGEGTRQRVEEFPVFSAKVLSGIDNGCLPDTLRDRTVGVRMKRRNPAAPEEQVERFRPEEAEATGTLLKARIERWVAANEDELALARPPYLDGLDDRAFDGWEPLLAIADRAGADWPSRARRAALALAAEDEREEQSSGARLLEAVKRAFEQYGHDRISTNELIRVLASDEEAPCAGWWDERAGKPEKGAPQRLAAQLKPYGIKRTTVRLAGDAAAKGYKREDFEEAWARYAAAPFPEPVTTVTTVTPPGANEPAVTGVTAVTPVRGKEARADAVRSEGLFCVNPRAHGYVLGHPCPACGRWALWEPRR